MRVLGGLLRSLVDRCSSQSSGRGDEGTVGREEEAAKKPRISFFSRLPCWQVPESREEAGEEESSPPLVSSGVARLTSYC